MNCTPTGEFDGAKWAYSRTPLQKVVSAARRGGGKRRCGKRLTISSISSYHMAGR